MGERATGEARYAVTDNDHPMRVRLFGKAQGEGAFELRDSLQRRVVAFDWIASGTPPAFSSQVPIWCRSDARRQSGRSRANLFTSKTSVPRSLAAGDVRSGSVKRLATALG